MKILILSLSLIVSIEMSAVIQNNPHEMTAEQSSNYSKVVNLNNPIVYQWVINEESNLKDLLAIDDDEQIYEQHYLPLLKDISDSKKTHLLLNAKESYKKNDSKKFIRELRNYFENN